MTEGEMKRQIGNLTEGMLIAQLDKGSIGTKRLALVLRKTTKEMMDEKPSQRAPRTALNELESKSTEKEEEWTRHLSALVAERNGLKKNAAEKEAEMKDELK